MRLFGIVMLCKDDETTYVDNLTTMFDDFMVAYNFMVEQAELEVKSLNEIENIYRIEKTENSEILIYKNDEVITEYSIANFNFKK